MLTKQDLQAINKSFESQTKNLESKLTNTLKRELKPVKQDIKKIRQDQNAIIKFFDEEYLDLRQRVEKLEQAVSSLTSN